MWILDLTDTCCGGYAQEDKGRPADGEDHRRFKARTLGTLRLLGELYNHGMLKANMLLKVV